MWPGIPQQSRRNGCCWSSGFSLLPLTRPPPLLHQPPSHSLLSCSYCRLFIMWAVPPPHLQCDYVIYNLYSLLNAIKQCGICVAYNPKKKICSSCFNVALKYLKHNVYLLHSFITVAHVLKCGIVFLH
jgi:hypothetical protein